MTLSPSPPRHGRCGLPSLLCHRSPKATNVSKSVSSKGRSLLASHILHTRDKTHQQFAHKTQLNLSALQNFPTSILLQILRHLDRNYLKVLFHSPSRQLKSAANLVLTERLALGISMYRGTEPFDPDQIRRKIALCGSIRASRDGGRLLDTRMARWSVGCEERGELDIRQVQRKAVLCGSIRGMGRDVVEEKGGGESDVLSRDVKAIKDDVDKVRASENGKWTLGPLNTPTASLATDADPFARTERFPDEIVLQILEAQSHKLLKSLLSCGSCQLRRVSETVLFERRCEIIGCPIRQKESCDGRIGRGLWPAISEKGEQYLGRKFVLVNCGRKGDREGQLGLEGGQGFQQLSLGSYWTVVCEDVSTRKVTVCS